jgi:hypothetical protein
VIPPSSFAALYRRDLARDPAIWWIAALLPLAAWTWRGLTPEVGVMSIYGAAALFLPPAILATLIPRLARRATWAFLASLAPSPARAFVAAAVGATLGLLPPLLAGAAAAAAIVAAPPRAALALLAALALVVIAFAAVAAAAAAFTLEPGRAFAVGAVVWGFGAVAYEPLLIALAVAFAEHPFEGALAAALLVNPLEIARLALLRTLDVPVFVGATGLLIERWWGAAAWALTAAAAIVPAALLLMLAGLRFARGAR